VFVVKCDLKEKEGYLNEKSGREEICCGVQDQGGRGPFSKEIAAGAEVDTCRELDF
jgi:hypothetical protein